MLVSSFVCYNLALHYLFSAVSQLDDHEMSDISVPPCPYDSDVAGPGATLNDDFMNADMDVLSVDESI